MSDLDDPTRDAAIRALCDFAEQPHPGRAGEAIDALERHLRACQPQPATGDSPHQVMASAPGEEEPGPANWPAGRRKLDPSTGEVTVYMWGYDDGVAKGRSEAEAMRRVVDCAWRLWKVPASDEPGMSQLDKSIALRDAVNALPDSLRPKKGTPDGK